MAILINKTYETYTPESLENGDAEDRGFVVEDEPFTFKELIRELRNYSEPSSSSGPYGTNHWATCYESDVNYRTGEVTNESIHYSHNNPSRNEKYWRWALEYVFKK